MAEAAASWHVEDDEQASERRRKEEVAVVLAAVATAVVLIQRFMDDQRLLVTLPGSAAAALQSSIQATAVALAKLQTMYANKKKNARKVMKSIPSRFGLENSSSSSDPWWQLINHGDDIQWRDSFRMSRSTFMKLVDTLGPVLQRQDTNTKDAIPADKKLAAALYRLAHGATFKVVARRFGMGASSCCKAFYEVCKGLEEKLGHLFDFPTSSQRVGHVSEGFTRLAGMPNCCGIIGCTNFSVERPMGDPGMEYLDHTKSNYGVVMQAVVDSASRFLDISVGWPGSYAPSAILLKTRFYSRIHQTRELLHGTSLDLGSGYPIPEYVLGDEAYPLHPWLVTPYGGGGCDGLQTLFNKAHRQATSPLRKAFGMLKEQWQLLKTKQRVDNIELMPFIVAASCLLHNFVIDYGEPMPQVEELDESLRPPVVEPDNVYGEGVRNGLAAFIGQCHATAAVMQ